MSARTGSLSLVCPTSVLPSLIYVGALLAGMFFYALSDAAGRPELSRFEHEVLQEMNQARQDPQGYARFLEQLKPYYVGHLFKPPNATPVATAEGIGAVNDAIRFLRTVRSVPRLRLSRGMCLGARQHVQDQGPRGTMGHQGSDGSSVGERINRYGTWRYRVAESITYGNETARQVVMSFIIDDGVATRDHRRTLFTPELQVVGIACGTHARYRRFCVATYAQEYRERE